MIKSVVLVAEELSPAALAVLDSDFEVRHVDGVDRDALLAAVADVNAIIVRSATKVDAEAAQRRASGYGWSHGPEWVLTTSTSRRPRRPASWS